MPLVARLTLAIMAGLLVFLPPPALGQGSTHVVAGEAMILRTGLRGEMYSLSFSPGSGLLAAIPRDGTVFLWQIRDGERKHVLRTRGQAYRCLAFSKDGETISAIGVDPVWKLFSWNVGNGAEREALRLTEGAHYLSQDAQVLATNPRRDPEKGGGESYLVVGHPLKNDNVKLEHEAA